jgi:hypothetical protein
MDNKKNLHSVHDAKFSIQYKKCGERATMLPRPKGEIVKKFNKLAPVKIEGIRA